MDLLDKVRLIIGHKCESPSQFADEIDIPRSAVSHLLNGRNKPSLEVIRKIITRYPELGNDWIWDEDKLPNLQSETVEKELPKPGLGMPLDLFSSPAVPETSQARVKAGSTPVRKVERVLLFYTDGTFEEFSTAR